MDNQAQLHKCLSLWHNAGMDCSFTFQDVMSNTTMGVNAPVFMRAVLGEAWALWYPKKEPQPSSVVPRRIALAVFMQLEAVRISWELESHAQDAGVAAYEVLRASLKRRMVEAADAAVAMSDA